MTDGENVTRYCYDNMGQLIREDNPYSQKTCVYAYDNCGNILSRTEYGYTDDETPTGGTAAVYEYNNAAWGDQLTSWNGESITYDAIGNPLLYRGRSLTWTQGRRLAGITAEGLNVTYTYDESGTRVGKTVNGVSTQYYINGSQILAQKSGEDILYFLYDETGSAVGFKYNNNLYIYRKNLQGDILAVLNGQTGAAEASYTYDAWGRVISSTGALVNLNPFRYRGYYYDGEMGLYYLQSRYYDPETGRFVNADSAVGQVQNIQGNNMYAYAFCNPVMYSDYTGNWPKLSLIFTVIAVTALAVAAVAATVATCGAAAPALALVSGSIASSCVAASTATAAAAVATTVATDAMIVAGVSAVAGIASAVTEREIERRTQGNNTVYKLVDANGQAQYIGRTTNIEARERAHKRSTYRGGLKMEIIATDLDYYEARGLEQIAMLECHTINTSNRMNNRINGISPRNRKLALYMEAGRGVAGYLDNVISDEILYWTGN